MGTPVQAITGKGIPPESRRQRRSSSPKAAARELAQTTTRQRTTPKFIACTTPRSTRLGSPTSQCSLNIWTGPTQTTTRACGDRPKQDPTTFGQQEQRGPTSTPAQPPTQCS